MAAAVEGRAGEISSIREEKRDLIHHGRTLEDWKPSDAQNFTDFWRRQAAGDLTVATGGSTPDPELPRSEQGLVLPTSAIGEFVGHWRGQQAQ